MRDGQLSRFLETYDGFVGGGIFEQVPRESSNRLSDILVDNPAPKFYLSAKAAAGILRRAERRGKTLPQPLEAALRALAKTCQDAAAKNPTAIT